MKRHDRYARALARACFPPRPRDGHKGTFGRALLACGSPAYTGAAALAAAGAFRAGAGLVFLLAPEEVLAPVRLRLPEVICRALPPVTRAPAAYLPQLALAPGEGALLLGCGIGREGDPAAFTAVLRELLVTPGAPLVLDADALNLLATASDCGRPLLRAAARPAVITPHPQEFSRLTGLPVADIQADRAGHAAAYAQETGAIVVLKGEGTVVAAPDGRLLVNPSGTPALAKGGSGDVLAGVLTGILAQGRSPFAAACAAVYLHGLAGERLARAFSEYGVLPSALPAAVACEIAALRR